MRKSVGETSGIELIEENGLDYLLLICNNTVVKKRVKIDSRAGKEIRKFPEIVQTKFRALFLVLEDEGFLLEPYAKRINYDLFEIRVKHQGQWRVVYAYLGKIEILILSGFHKKTQKMPNNEIKRALKRLKDY